MFQFRKPNCSRRFEFAISSFWGTRPLLTILFHEARPETLRRAPDAATSPVQDLGSMIIIGLPLRLILTAGAAGVKKGLPTLVRNNGEAAVHACIQRPLSARTGCSGMQPWPCDRRS